MQINGNFGSARHLSCLLFLATMTWAMGAVQQGFRLQRFGYAPEILVGEGEGADLFNVTVPEQIKPVSVEYRVVGRSAMEGQDFVANSGVLHFPPNTWRVDLKVEILDDAEIEGREDFEIQLFNATAGIPIETPSSMISLLDDERGYAVLIHSRPWENDPYFDVRVDRMGDFQFSSTVELRLIPETAVAGVDYIDETHTLKFQPGETLAIARLRLLNDTVEDGDKRLRIALVNPTGGVPIDLSEATLVITDNEQGFTVWRPPTASIWQWFSSRQEGDYHEGPEPFITVYHWGDYVERTTAKISFLALSSTDEHASFAATPGVDFTSTTIEVEFEPGQTSARVPIPIINDAEPEPLEYLKVKLNPPVGEQQAEEWIFPIHDNEFNPLLVAEVCPDNDGENVLAIYSGGSGQVLLTVATLEKGVLLKRLDENGAFDRSFAAPAIQPDELHVLRDGKILYRNGGVIGRLHRDGTEDAEFQRLIDSSIRAACPGLDGTVFVALFPRLIRLKTDGTVDSTFAGEVSGDIQKLVAAPDGGVYACGWFGVPGIQKLTASGALDGRFSYVASPNAEGNYGPIDISIYGEQLYVAAGGKVQRLLSDGNVDPSFVPFELIEGFPILRDAAGRFYSLAAADLSVEVQRHNSNGTPDPAYLRGTLQGSTASFLQVAMLGEDRLAILARMADLNGVRMRCANPVSRPAPSPYPGVLQVHNALARVELNAGHPRIAADPGDSWQLIEEAGRQTLTILRTGENQAPLNLQYRLRSGTAQEWKHFVPEEGTLNFEAGQSHVRLPISLIDNLSWAGPGFFYLEILNAEGVWIPAVEVPIASWDIGLDIANRSVLSTGRWSVPVINQITPSSELWSTKDFRTFRFHGHLWHRDTAPIDPTAANEFYFLHPSFEN